MREIKKKESNVILCSVFLQSCKYIHLYLFCFIYYRSRVNKTSTVTLKRDTKRQKKTSKDKKKIE